MTDETVLRVHSIRTMNSPTRENRHRLWQWLRSREGGNNFLQNSIEASPWHDVKLEELLTLSPKDDHLDHWLSDTLTPLYHTLYGHRMQPDLNHELGLGRLWTYNKKWIRRLGDLVCVLLSSAVPVASIQGLYWIPTTFGRLSMITCFIIFFAFILAFITGCRRSEIFAATSAFAAVLVVFLQGLNGSVNSPAS